MVSIQIGVILFLFLHIPTLSTRTFLLIQDLMDATFLGKTSFAYFHIQCLSSLYIHVYKQSASL